MHCASSGPFTLIIQDQHFNHEWCVMRRWGMLASLSPSNPLKVHANVTMALRSWLVLQMVSNPEEKEKSTLNMSSGKK